MRPHRAPRFAFALATITVIAACGSDQAGRTAERTLARSQALSATSLPGTSLPAKTLCLTFDDGPGYGTSDISAYLAAQGVPATFFVNGAYIAATTLPNDNAIKLTPNAAAILAQVVADGHLVANHGTTHRSLPAVLATFGAAKVVQEVAETDADIAPYVPSSHFLFRAPYGFHDALVWNALAPSAMNKYVGPLGWDIGGTTSSYPTQAADWACWVNALQSGGAGPTFGATPQECGDAYLAEITAAGRGIVLMHDSSHTDNGGTTFEMVQYIVPILKARGYTFVRADEVPAVAALLPQVPCDAGCATCDAGTGCAPDAAPPDAAPPDAAPPDAAPPDVVTEDSTTPPDAAAPVVISDERASDAPEPGCSVTRAPVRAGNGSTRGHDGALLIAIGALSAAFLRRTRSRPS